MRPRRLIARCSVVGILSFFPVTALASSPTVPPWDRVLRSSDVQVTAGHIAANFHVAIIDSTAALQNLNTIVQVSVNDGPPQRDTVAIAVLAGGWGFCRTECLSCSFLECLQLSTPNPPFDFCSCAVAAVSGFNLALRPGDVIHLALLPAPGAVAEQYTGDDVATIVVPPAVSAPAIDRDRLWLLAFLIGVVGLFVTGRARARMRGKSA